ncbi:MAG TPA: SURF1 family protein [Nocardioides sp.]|nr:SURF1 family protein [Nocardioides sp.]
MVAPTLRALLAPRVLLLHVLGVVATVAAVLLGLWQLDAWQAGRDAEARDLAGEAPRPLTGVMTADEPFPGADVGRPVTLAGTWLPESTLLVDGRDLDGRTGLWVVTPVAVCADDSTSCDPGTDPAMLVVRGWTPAPTAVPPPPEGPVELTGWLQPGEGTGAPDPDPADDVLAELRIASAIQHVDQDLYGAYVVARDGVDRDGLEPVTPESLPAPSTLTSLQNLLYAVQWWIFGAFAVFLWQRWVRDELARRRATAEEESGASHRDEPAPAEPDTAGIRSTP